MTQLFNDEQDVFIRENAEGLLNQELADLVNITFGLDLTATQVKSFKRNHLIQSGVTGYFEKGHVPENKGKKYPGQTNKTSFKNGNKPHNYKPVGTERINGDGYVDIKISEKKWKAKHILIWEDVNGPIPKGHCLIFLDGNKQNILLGNLQQITRSQLARLNQNHLISDNADLTKTGLIIADIYGKIGERKKAK